LPVLDDSRDEAFVVIFQVFGNGHEKSFIINEQKCPVARRVKKPVLSSEPAIDKCTVRGSLLR
jgi:hypothetical protein